MIVLAANLRAAITGVGPLIHVIEANTGLSTALSGSLTTLSLLAFFIFSPVAPAVARRIGIESTILISLAALIIGIWLRCFGGQVGLLAGMFVLGGGIAMGNVLLPSLIKRDFPNHVGWLTGAYSVSMNVFAALGSGLSVPLADVHGLGWRGSLASWSVLAAIGFVLWLPHIRRQHMMSPRSGTSMWNSPVAWHVTLFMGLQSLTFYVNVTWLPQILTDRGMTVTTAGWCVSLMQMVSVPASFIVPILAARKPSQRGLVAWMFVLFFVGYLGLLFNIHAATWLCVILIGISGGGSISLALAMFGLRTKTSDDAARLSGMAQSIGYLIAAIGPILIGLVHGVTGSWNLPLELVEVDVILMLIFGYAAGRPTVIEPHQ